MSEIVIAPENLLDNKVVLEGSKTFNGLASYDGMSFTLGFIQTFADDETHSASIPVLAFNSTIMEGVAKHQPEAMLRHFQSVMTAGNHDMQHHYSNRVLNPNISIASQQSQDFHPMAYTVKKWFEQSFDYFGDTDPNSYESWLMLNHARVRRKMEKSAEGENLKKSCDAFFDELARIGREKAAESVESAHRTVDYFGSMLCFALMRFMPLNHPMIDQAINLLEKADPDSQATTKRAQKIMDAIAEEAPYVEATLANYKKQGLDLMPVDADSADYLTVKRLQLLHTAPWIVHLFSKAQQGTDLAKVQNRVGRISGNMIKAAALSSAFYAGSGKTCTKYDESTTVEAWHKNNLLHRIDGPAYIETGKHGLRREKWYNHGELYRDDGPAEVTIETTGGTKEKWYRNRKIHRDNGPAVTEINSYGTKTEEWYQNGVRVCQIETRKNGKRFERHYDSNVDFHREDGPAYTIEEPSGNCEKAWYKNGERHRVGGPAYFVKSGTGETTEAWYESGERHRIGGPAYLAKSDTGATTEVWYESGERHRIGGPARVVTNLDGSRTEKWYVNDVFIKETEVPPPKEPARSSKMTGLSV